MNFYDIVTEMGYQIVDKDKQYIHITKESEYVAHEPLAITCVTFDITKKEIFGYIHPLRDFFCLDDYSHIYHSFLKLKEDLKKFADLSKYAII